ncbi:MAG: hypothetical protein K5682_02570 [Lachnospiraceae bacterium]|nr:hypothetical protein [Lachnospiraceae bacterium]
MFWNKKRDLYLGTPADLYEEDRKLLIKYGFYWRGLILGLLLIINGMLVNLGFGFYWVEFVIVESGYGDKLIGDFLAPSFLVGLLLGTPLALTMAGKVRKIDSTRFLEPLMAKEMSTEQRSRLEILLDCVRIPGGIRHTRTSGIKGTVEEIRNVEFARKFFHVFSPAFLVTVLTVVYVAAFCTILMNVHLETLHRSAAVENARKQTIDRLATNLDVYYTDDELASVLIRPYGKENEEDYAWTGLDINQDGTIVMYDTWNSLFVNYNIDPGEEYPAEWVKEQLEELRELMLVHTDLMDDSYPAEVEIVFTDNFVRALTEGIHCDLMEKKSSYYQYEETIIVPLDGKYYYVYPEVQISESGFSNERQYVTVTYSIDGSGAVTSEAWEEYKKTGVAPKYQYERNQ